MRLLITGGAGFIGSATVHAALAAGHRVVTLDKLTYAGSLDNLGDGPLNSNGHRFVQGDIADGELLATLFRVEQPDAVLHLAAETHVDRSIDAPTAFIDSNIVGTVALLNAARRYRDGLTGERADRFRFLHISTDEVYGALGNEGAFDDASPYRPNSPYAASKASADMLVRAWGRTYGLPVLITNCSNNYGPRQFPEKLIPLTVLNAIHGLPIPVYGSGSNVRDWLYVEDHVSALMTILERGCPGEIYLVGGRAEQRNIDLVRRICRLLDEWRPNGRPYEDLISFVSDRPGHDFRYAIDDTRLRTSLDWSPRIGIDEGIRRTVAWYLDNEPWWQARCQGRWQSARLGLGAVAA